MTATKAYRPRKSPSSLPHYHSRLAVSTPLAWARANSKLGLHSFMEAGGMTAVGEDWARRNEGKAGASRLPRTGFRTRKTCKCHVRLWVVRGIAKCPKWTEYNAQDHSEPAKTPIQERKEANQ